MSATAAVVWMLLGTPDAGEFMWQEGLEQTVYQSLVDQGTLTGDSPEDDT